MDRCASTGDMSCVPPCCWEGAQAGDSCRDGANAPRSLSCRYLLASFLEFAFFVLSSSRGVGVFFSECRYLCQQGGSGSWGREIAAPVLGWAPGGSLCLLPLHSSVAPPELHSQLWAKPGGQGIGRSGDSPCSYSALGSLALKALC